MLLILSILSHSFSPQPASGRLAARRGCSVQRLPGAFLTKSSTSVRFQRTTLPCRIGAGKLPKAFQRHTVRKPTPKYSATSLALINGFVNGFIAHLWNWRRLADWFPEVG